MAEEPNKVPATPVPTPGDNTPENEPEGDKKEEDLSKETVLAQKRHWREKAKKLEADLAAERAKALAPKPESNKRPEPPLDNSRLDGLEMAVHNRDLDESDLRELADVAKAKGVSWKDARETPLFKAYLADKAQKKREADAAPNAPSRSPKFEKDDDFSSVQPDDIDKMDAATFTRYEAWLKLKG